MAWREVEGDDGPAVELEVVVRRDLLLDEDSVVLAGDPGDAVAAAAGPWTAVATDAEGAVVATDTWEG